MTNSEENMEIKPNSKIESITILSGAKLSPIDRANSKISEADFAEVRIVKNSPKRLEIIAIKKGIKPTEGFRKAIKDASLINESFN